MKNENTFFLLFLHLFYTHAKKHTHSPKKLQKYTIQRFKCFQLLGLCATFFYYTHLPKKKNYFYPKMRFAVNIFTLSTFPRFNG